MVKILKSNHGSYIKSKFENNPNNIQMDGVATVGVSNHIARSDHIHPHDTTKADKDHSHDTATSNKSGFLSSDDKSKLDTIEDNANNYSHPTHTQKTLGLYKINVDDKGHVSQTGAVTLNDLQEIGVPVGSNEYTHPQNRSFVGKPEADAQPSFGGSVTVSTVTTDNYGHVMQMFDRKIVFPAAEVSQANKGLMGSQDKIKLDNIEQNANKTTVDSRLSLNSNNPVSNNTIVNALNDKSDVGHTHSVGEVSNLQSLLDAKSDNDHLHSNSRDRYQILLVKYNASNNTFESEDNLQITIGNNMQLACIVRNKWTGKIATELNVPIFIMINDQSYQRTLQSGVSGGLDFHVTGPVLVMARLKNGADYNTSFDMKYVQ